MGRGEAGGWGSLVGCLTFCVEPWEVLTISLSLKVPYQECTVCLLQSKYVLSCHLAQVLEKHTNCFAGFVMWHCANLFSKSPRLNGWRTRWLSEMTPSSGRSASRVSVLWRSGKLGTLMVVFTPAEPRMIMEKQSSAASWMSNVRPEFEVLPSLWVYSLNMCFVFALVF